MNIQGPIVGIIGAVIMVTIGLNFVGPLSGGNDAFYRLNAGHCKVGDTTTRNLIAGSVVVPVTMGASNICTATTTETTGVTEDGTSVTITSNVLVSGVWTPPPSFLGNFRGIVLLIISLIPLMVAIGFIGIAFRMLKDAKDSVGSGGDQISTSIGMDVAIMLGVVVASFVAEPFQSGVGTAASTVTVGNLDSADQFNTITRLIYSLLPLGYAVGMITLVAKPLGGWSAAKGVYARYKPQMGM